MGLGAISLSVMPDWGLQDQTANIYTTAHSSKLVYFTRLLLSVAHSPIWEAQNFRRHFYTITSANWMYSSKSSQVNPCVVD